MSFLIFWQELCACSRSLLFFFLISLCYCILFVLPNINNKYVASFVGRKIIIEKYFVGILWTTRRAHHFTFEIRILWLNTTLSLRPTEALKNFFFWYVASFRQTVAYAHYCRCNRAYFDSGVGSLSLSLSLLHRSSIILKWGNE